MTQVAGAALDHPSESRKARRFKRGTRRERFYSSSPELIALTALRPRWFPAAPPGARPRGRGAGSPLRPGPAAQGGRAAHPLARGEAPGGSCWARVPAPARASCRGRARRRRRRHCLRPRGGARPAGPRMDQRRVAEFLLRAESQRGRGRRPPSPCSSV